MRIYCLSIRTDIHHDYGEYYIITVTVAGTVTMSGMTMVVVGGCCCCFCRSIANINSNALLLFAFSLSSENQFLLRFVVRSSLSRALSLSLCENKGEQYQQRGNSNTTSNTPIALYTICICMNQKE